MAYRLLINGELRDGAGTLEVINPATGQVAATCARADAAQLEEAVAAAAAAFPAWSARSYADRGKHLAAIADAIDARHDEFVRTLTLEQGKPLAEAEMETYGASAVLRYYSQLELPLTMLSESQSNRVYEQRTALGVVAAITPWNFPLMILCAKVAGALCAGNTVVAKPAPTTPLTAAMLGEAAAAILPPGVLNVIMDANDLGAALTAHPGIAKVTFTGSTATGRKVFAAGAATIKRLTLELGGNDAAIVLDDAPVKPTAEKLFRAAMVNAGQVCLAAKRIYVPRARYDEYCEELGKLADAAVVDDGTRQGVDMGPIQNRQQFDRVRELIADAARHGRIVAGGTVLDRDGYFIRPTIVRDLPDDARLVREEQFGPVVPVLAYDSVDEVLERANDTEFGLGGTIWTGNAEHGLELAQRVQSGTVWVNSHLDFSFDTPLGGAKQSGFGREYGLEGLKEFTQAKILSVAIG